MKLFILQTSEQWRHCGGGAVVIAERFEDVWPLLQAEHEREHRDSYIEIGLTDTDIPKIGPIEPVFRSEAEVTKDGFVVVETFDVSSQQPRVVMLNFNEA